MKHLFTMIALFFHMLLFAQAVDTMPEPVGDVRLIMPIVESPPMTPTEAKAFAHFQTFRNWGITRLGIDSVMSHFTGADVTVCICDTGVSDHEAIEGTVFASKNFSPDPTVKDGNGHGGHVHGIISEIAPDAQILVAKVLGDAGLGSNAGVAAGVRWCAEQGADVINMSLGSSSPNAQLKNAIDDVINMGVVIVAAAGNDGQSDTENRMGYPARYTETVAVGSFNYDYQLSYFSSSGAEGDVIAPGEHILSTWKGQQYVVLSGTSMAAPFVTGMIALKIEQIRETVDIELILERTSIDVAPAGFDEETFNGIVSKQFFDEQVIVEPGTPDDVEGSDSFDWTIALIIVVIAALVLFIGQFTKGVGNQNKQFDEDFKD